MLELRLLPSADPSPALPDPARGLTGCVLPPECDSHRAEHARPIAGPVDRTQCWTPPLIYGVDRLIRRFLWRMIDPRLDLNRAWPARIGVTSALRMGKTLTERRVPAEDLCDIIAP